MHSEGAQSPNIQTLEGDLRYDDHSDRSVTNIFQQEPLKPWTNYGHVVAWGAAGGMALSLVAYAYAVGRQEDFDRARSRYAGGSFPTPAEEQLAWSKLEHDKVVVDRVETAAVIGLGLSTAAALVALAFRLVEGSSSADAALGNPARLEWHF